MELMDSVSKREDLQWSGYDMRGAVPTMCMQLGNRCHFVLEQLDLTWSQDWTLLWKLCERLRRLQY